jgi:hypothetical protein
MNNRMHSYHFAAFRIYLGLYLAIVFFLSLESSTTLWSREGFVPHASLNQTFGIFPNMLNYFDSPSQIRIFIFGLIAISLFFTFGLLRQLTAVLLWYGLTCLLNRNNLIINPSIHYNGWLLLACALIPSGEYWSLSRQNPDWQKPGIIAGGAWILFAVGYFLSGFDKLFSTSWVDGTALQKIIEGPFGNNLGTASFQLLPVQLTHLLSWLIIVIEMICLPFSIFQRTRQWAWMIATILQLCFLMFLSLSTIAAGMLALHLFLFDPKWFDMGKLIHRLKLKYHNSPTVAENVK